MLKRDEFNSLLEDACLTKIEFCELIGLEYKSVNNWGTPKIDVPKWVESWLKNYIERKKLEKIKEILKEEIKD
ncbi:XRE family transcriptional regulator [Aliarcobacter butzleri]|uniref:XRE family transcriptional regulator n=1 Tax=Aliarcobacter butzleri TaxID=28197 RepID=A0AAW7Q058_9BACT|nr:XRE family transcriptional regulator [Aliarcobacter butzleri]MCG3655438.1 XRE family transcriptional regulator [Aliarcobacter butzleri]MCG3684345.1 XRE family transcriptional regulator [Aliarcobacter butzleri]MCG3688477.1 XRE family transcriptional regulator [Aliarcobacter butzleri]MCG3706785.1 XRE family transcriptional regulator [Aliarcobacter butzleri]MCG3711530.1 XRE family transcriptional regulator [Aliarcobacter butzleri]